MQPDLPVLRLEQYLMNWIVFAVLAGIVAAFFLIRYLSILRINQHIGMLKNRRKETEATEALNNKKEARRLEAEMHIVKSIYRNKTARNYTQQEQTR